MPPIEDGQVKIYWRSPEELAGTDEFRQLASRSFPGRSWDSLPPSTRRQFLKVMGASLALAGLAGCRWPKEEIVPFSRPVGYTPGVPEQYATSFEIGGTARGLLVTSFDGRPIKIEGNPAHPESRGASDALSQATVLELYDPSRSRVVVRRERGQRRTSTWNDFAGVARPLLETGPSAGGARFRVLCEASSSLSLDAMRSRLLTRFPGAKWYSYEAVSRDNERSGASLAFGEPYRTHFSLDKARLIVCLDADPIMAHPAAVRHARDFAEGRRARNGSMNRLYSIESTYSITGAMADHRFAVSSRRIAGLTRLLAVELFNDRGIALPEGAEEIRADLDRLTDPEDRPPFLSRIAGELIDHRGESLLIAGPRQPAEVHAVVHLINIALGNVGRTVDYTLDPDPQRPSHAESIRMLVQEMHAGEVDTLLILGGNPVYDAPADLDFAAHLGSVATSIHLDLFEDETSRACTWHLPRAHYLESWGDARAFDGTICTVQPLIEPLYGGKSPIEVLSILLDDPPLTGHEIVRRSIGSYHGGADIDRFWRTLIHDGVLTGSAFKRVHPRLRLDRSMLQSSAFDLCDDELEIVFCPDSKTYDGRFANNSWLQELPDPLTKLTWDNAALLSPATATRIGVEADDVVVLRYRGREIELPVYIMPGQAPGSVAVGLGYGRTAAGRIGDGVGVDLYRLRTSEAMDFDGGLLIRRTGRKHRLACTQNHHAIDLIGLRGMHERIDELVREADLETYRADPDFARNAVHHPPLVSLWKEHEFGGHRWGMAIDLSCCTGCSACVIACQSENNIPVVGRKQVLNSREMHWIRIDRYFSGDLEDPRVVHQPVACVQCENAPCEQVCPVAATSHSEEGLNQMVYNRCIGTRYCSNNCPYKVRRFNWFNNQKHLTAIEKMVRNPEVTVRSRGVMEKCTYCVQRIEAAKIHAKNVGRSIRDGEIVPACAQACPTQAIVFGDLSDTSSRVHRLHQDGRSYGMLEEINTKPRTRYLARLTNPAPGASRKAEHGR